MQKYFIGTLREQLSAVEACLQNYKNTEYEK